jgi:hypothetical protein
MGIKLKRSGVAGKAPAATDLDLGELAVNTYDGKLFLRKNDGTDAILEVGPVRSVAGRTGAVTLARGDVGLSNVDNTSDAAKPVSAAMQAALDAKLAASGGTLEGYRLKLNARGNVSGAQAIDYALGNYVTATVTGATQWSVTNTPASGIGGGFLLVLTNAGSAAVTWMSGTKWPGGTAPSLTASGIDLLAFTTHDGGATWRGAVIALDAK